MTFPDVSPGYFYLVAKLLTPQECRSTRISDGLRANIHLGACGPFYVYGPRYFPQQMWDPPVTNFSVLTIGFPFVG